MSAQAQTGWYVSGSVGALQKEPHSGPSAIDFASGAVIHDQRTETFDPGLLANLAVGHHLPLGFRVEAEFGYAYFKSDKINISSATPIFNGDFPLAGGGDFNRYMLTVNGFYDLPQVWFLRPYIGVGLGWAHLTQSSTVFRAASGAALRHNANQADDTVGLIEGGIAIPISAHAAIVPAYRYLRIFNGNQGQGDEADHILKVGFRYTF